MIYTSVQTKNIDSRAINQMNIPGITLMQNAAEKILKVADGLFGSEKKVCVICGSGNNGGDGFALAPMLKEKGREVSVIRCFDKPLSDDASHYYEKLGDIPVIEYFNTPEIALNIIKESSLVIDAIYGNGFHGSLNDSACEICDAVNESKCKVLAVDIPSGCVCDNGAVYGKAVRADVTVALSTLKPCYMLYPAIEYCGRISLQDIGIPKECYDGEKAYITAIDNDMCTRIYRPRKANSHKGTFGKLAVVCGSKSMPGAAAMVALGALRTGVGIVRIAAENEVCNAASGKFFEPVFSPYATRKALSDDVPAIIKDSSAVVTGCGCGKDKDTESILVQLISQKNITVIVDADGINALKTHEELLGGNVIITPHPKEMADLLDIDTASVLDDPINKARDFSLKYGCVAVLKGACTVIAAPDGGVFLNSLANSGMAKGGSGDLLAGIMGSFAAQGYEPLDAALISVYLHSAAGYICREKVGEEGMLPSDLPYYFKTVFDSFKEGSY